MLTEKDFKVDYIEMADADYAWTGSSMERKTKIVALVAAFSAWSPPDR